MAELQQTRYDRLIRRVGGIIGPGSMVGEAISELFPMIDVEDPPLELLALMGTNIAMASSRLLALAGNVNHHQLHNPDDSNHLLVCQKMIVSSDTAQRMRLSLSLNPITLDVGNVNRRDSRPGLGGRSVGQNRSQQTPGGLAAVFEFTIQAGVPFTVEDPNGLWVIFPLSGITIASTQELTETIVSWFWREREFLPSEANF